MTQTVEGSERSAHGRPAKTSMTTRKLLRLSRNRWPRNRLWSIFVSTTDDRGDPQWPYL